MYTKQRATLGSFFNDITDLTGLITCTNILALNLSHNSIKNADYLPGKIEILDISFNMLSSAFSLRVLALCPKITSLCLVGNPVTKRVPDWKQRILCFLPSLLEVDNMPVARGIVMGRTNKIDPQEVVVAMQYNSPRQRRVSAINRSPHMYTSRRRLASPSSSRSFASYVSSCHEEVQRSSSPYAQHTGKFESPSEKPRAMSADRERGRSGTSSSRGSFFGLYSKGSSRSRPRSPCRARHKLRGIQIDPIAID